MLTRKHVNIREDPTHNYTLNSFLNYNLFRNYHYIKNMIYVVVTQPIASLII